ncbi:MAG: hypothetical protein HC842_01805, partial [Cytophagales bacterium]|nr:hypothetical protein [Cytophagales bacterium]
MLDLGKGAVTQTDARLSLYVSDQAYERSLQRLSQSSPYSVQHLVLDSGHLSIVLSYPGGCVDHTFVLSTTGKANQTGGEWATHPYALSFTLLHGDRNDRCEALIFDTLVYRVDTLQELARDSLRLCFQLPDGDVLCLRTQQDSCRVGGAYARQIRMISGSWKLSRHDDFFVFKETLANTQLPRLTLRKPACTAATALMLFGWAIAWRPAALIVFSNCTKPTVIREICIWYMWVGQ